MKRISVHIPEEQQEWIDHVALEIDGSRSDVVQRAITAYRRERDDIDDAAPGPTESESIGPDEPATNGQSRAELLERVEKLEETLQGTSASVESADEDGGGETEAEADADAGADTGSHGNGDHDDDEFGDESVGWR